MSWTNTGGTPITPLVTIGSFNNLTPAIVVPSGGTIGVPFTGGQKITSGPYSPYLAIDVSTFASYDINLYAFDTTNTVNTLDVKIVWFNDLTSGIPVFQEDWWIWVSDATITPPDNPMAGTGPMHGRYMAVVLNNTQGLQPVNFYWFDLFGSNRTVPQSDWRQNVTCFTINGTNNGSPTNAHWAASSQSEQATGSTTFGTDDKLMDLAGIPLTGPANYFFYMPLFAGSVYYRFGFTGAAPTSFQIMDCGQNLQPGGWSSQKTLWRQAAPAINTEYSGSLFLPRSACAVFFVIPSASTVTVFSQISAQQGF